MPGGPLRHRRRFRCRRDPPRHNYLASAFLSPLINRRTDELSGVGQLRQGGPWHHPAVRAEVDRDGTAAIAVTAKPTWPTRGPGRDQPEESLQTARWLQDDGGRRTELTAGSSLVNPIPVPRRLADQGEFSAAFTPPLSWGYADDRHPNSSAIRTGRLCCETPSGSAANSRCRLILLGGITNRGDHGSGEDGGGIRLRRDGLAPAGRA